MPSTQQDFNARTRTINDEPFSHAHARAHAHAHCSHTTKCSMHCSNNEKIKYCQHSIEFARLSNPIEFDHRLFFFLSVSLFEQCACVYLFGFRVRIYISI